MIWTTPVRPNVGNAVGADGAGLGRAEGAPDARVGAAVGAGSTKY